MNYQLQKIAAATTALAILASPLLAGAESMAGSSLNGNVSQPASTITINSIIAVKNNGVADGTFENGWRWIFDITVPAHEQNLAMKFENWMMAGFGNSMIPVANNMRFYSDQSSNAFNQNTAIFISASNTYSPSMFLTGNLGAPQGSRRVQITVETRIPNGTTAGSYSTNFGIKTQ